MSSDNTPAKDSVQDSIQDEMKRISDVTKPDTDRPTNEKAGFSLPFGWGKKKKNEPAPPPPAAAPPPPAAQTQAPQAPADRTYTVQAGDTLWDIATRYYGDGRQYPKIARANNIADPDVINIGVVLKIPE